MVLKRCWLLPSFLGIVLLASSAAAVSLDDQPQEAFSLLAGQPDQIPGFAQLVIIEAVDLGGSQLLVKANKSFTYTVGWERGAYRITIRSAKLSSQVKEPRLGPTSPLSQIRLRQEDPQTVTILVYSALGVRIAGVSKPTAQSLLLQLQRPSIAATTPPKVVIVPQPPLPPLSQAAIARVVVVIDPGHGGPDPGAVGIGGLQEKQVINPIATEVASLLQQQGVQAILTRLNDRALGLAPRVALAKQVNADIFVSIHANAISLSRPEVNGLETYHYSSGSRLAQTIHSSILQSISFRDRGVKRANFYVLKRNPIPAILVEVGFVTGAEDAPRLAEPAFRSQMAAAITRGILQYLQASP